MDIASLEVRIGRTTGLPVFPRVAVQIMSLANNPDATAREFERLINQDSGMAARILRTANSAAFSTGREITSVKRALLQLGVGQIRSIATAAAVQAVTANKKINKHFDAAAFYRHSLAVALAAKLIATLDHHDDPEEAFTAGMLHDIGKLAIALFLPDELLTIYAASLKSGMSHFAAERAVLSLDHQEIGELAAKLWGLPTIYHAPIRFHHTPLEGSNFGCRLVTYIHVANSLASSLGLTVGPSDETDRALPLLLASLGIPVAQWGPIHNTLEKQLETLSKQAA
jgi:HD-like signal output (HDOD) protein